MISSIYNSLSAGGVLMFMLFALNVFGWYLVFSLYFKVRKEYISCLEYHEGKSENNSLLTLLNISLRENGKSLAFNTSRTFIIKNILPYYRVLSSIKMLGAIAPLLGLLGTVFGMIATFETIEAFGNTNPALMAGGISEALLTTQAGLLTAFPLMFMHTVLKNRLNHLSTQIEDCYYNFLRYGK